MSRGHIIDLTGQRFGRLVAEKFHSLRKGRAMWECRCDCGNRHIVQAGRLRGNRTRSCGCLRRDKSAERAFRHGMLRTPTYLTWVSMIQRCENPKATGYEYYGGSGISVCEEWHKFENFLADMGERPSDRTLDRKNSFGHYEPGNCRWATKQEQRDNWRERL